jgi:SET domain-containing protein
MHEFIEVKFISKKKGRGAFAKKTIKKGTIIDIAPVIPLLNRDYNKIYSTKLSNYCFVWEDPKHKPEFKKAIIFSICQFINHSYEPNAKYLYSYIGQVITFKAIKNIEKGEEITINYNGLVSDKSPVWFKVI